MRWTYSISSWSPWKVLLMESSHSSLPMSDGANGVTQAAADIKLARCGYSTDYVFRRDLVPRNNVFCHTGREFRLRVINGGQLRRGKLAVAADI